MSTLHLFAPMDSYNSKWIMQSIEETIVNVAAGVDIVQMKMLYKLVHFRFERFLHIAIGLLLHSLFYCVRIFALTP